MLAGFILLFSALPLSLVAQELQSLDEIRETAYFFAKGQLAADGEDVTITVSGLDRRLRLAACSLPLEAYLPPGVKLSGSATIGVRCDGEKPWSLLLQVRVQHFGKVVVAARPLARRSVLGESDILLERHDLSTQTSGYFTELEPVEGMILKRSVRAGTVLGPILLAQPMLVKKGEKVTIRAESGSIQVRMGGVALSDGARGEVIRVRNNSSQKVIEAEVVSAGVVQVRM